MGASRPMDELRQEAAGLIRERLETLSVTEAADALGVSRQTIYDIKNDKYCPSLSLVQRACEAWEIKFEFRGVTVGKDAFRKRKTKSSAPSDEQLRFALVEAIRQVDHNSLEVIKAKPMGRSVEIVIRLTIPA